MPNQRLDCTELVDRLPVIQTIFESKQEAIEFCERYQNIGKLWALYHVAQFSYFLDNIEDTTKHDDSYFGLLIDVTRLIMVASIVERLNSPKDFVRFDKWVKLEHKENELQVRGVVVWHDYNKIHGSAEKFRTFFTKYLAKEEKIGLMRAVRFWREANKNYVPLFCFKDADCHVSHSFCTFDYDKTKCPAFSSSRRLNKGMRECANFLYHLRSKFVHEAKLLLLPEPLPKGVGGSSWLIDYIEYDFLTKEYKHEGNVSLEIFSNTLVKLGKKYLKKLIKQYLKTREDDKIHQSVNE